MEMKDLDTRGVYNIVNNISGKRYIWVSQNLPQREFSHFSALMRWKHEHKYLQKDFNKYGIDNFYFQVLEYIPNQEESYKREKELILNCDIRFSYNISEKLKFKHPSQYQERLFIIECLQNIDLVKWFLKRNK